MQPLTPKELSTEILNFLLKGNNPALFAGAGVGARAGLPDWPQYMELLALAADPQDPLTAGLIRKRAASGHFLEAAVVYKSCPDIPIGDRYRQLSEPFRTVPNPQKRNRSDG